MCGFRSLNNSTSKILLDLFEPVKLTVWKVMIERVTVVKFRMDDVGGNDMGGYSEVHECDSNKMSKVQ